MSLRDPQPWEAMEDTGVLLLARVVDWDGNLLTQANTTSVTVTCYDKNSTPPDKLELTATPAVADVIFDTEQSGGNWPYDDGYTFKYPMPATALPTGGHGYVVEVMITPASGEVFMLDPYHIDVINRRGG